MAWREFSTTRLPQQMGSIAQWARVTGCPDRYCIVIYYSLEYINLMSFVEFFERFMVKQR